VSGGKSIAARSQSISGVIEREITSFHSLQSIRTHFASTFVYFTYTFTVKKNFILIRIQIIHLHENIIVSSSLSAYYSPLLDIGLSNLSPSRSIFGYSHPAPASRPEQIVTPPGLRRPTLRLSRRGLHSRTRLPQRLSVLL
jgi:hypothetical protein